MCDICKNSYTVPIDITIESRDSKMTLCPNCVAYSISDKTLKIPEGSYVSEISGEMGAVKITDLNVIYLVTPDEALRLLGHALLPDEFTALINGKHSMDEFELHDDFYTDDGLAYQPVIEDRYIEDMNAYLKTAKLTRKTRDHIANFLAEFI